MARETSENPFRLRMVLDRTDLYGVDEEWLEELDAWWSDMEVSNGCYKKIEIKYLDEDELPITRERAKRYGVTGFLLLIWW